ncbi:hypothetical protein NPIRD3C_1536 [Nitrosopumilus piranensis]|uniref:Uncharacterized protein n=2 Tax=Nitrosopumilaceae TaxID=338190 RepID=A0A0C5BSI2_9ARCH|nr:hypothetical protein NPIRD3C_1536 [Nitrosopumilus piranensis]
MIHMVEDIELKIQKSEISTAELISHFREKCKICGHHRIMHDAAGKCEGVMNKPCTSGCDKFEAE